MTRTPITLDEPDELEPPRGAWFWWFLFGLVGCVCFLFASHAFGDVKPYFVPGDDCRKVLIAEIEAAKESILVLAYNFTDQQVSMALQAAQERGVAVAVVLDYKASHQATAQGYWLRKAGCQVRTDKKHAIQHNKVMIFDSVRMVTGSYNFSASANERNAENLLVIWDEPETLEAYSRDWWKHWEHGVPL